MGDPSSCSTDFDCPASLLCYENVSWAEGSIVCGCNYWWGWEGDDCTQLGLQSYISFAIRSTSGVIALLGSITTVQMLYLLLKHKSKENNLWNATTVTIIYSGLGMIGFVGWNAVAMISILTPIHGDLKMQDNPEKKFHQLTPENRIFATISMTFAVLASLNIGVIWLEVAKSSSRIRRMISGKLSAYKKIAYAFEILFTLIVIVLMANNKPDLTAIVAAPFFFFVAVVCFVGQHKMSVVLRGITSAMNDSSSAESNKKYKNILRLIKLTAQRIAFFCTLVIILSGLYAWQNLTNFKEYIGPGKIGTVVTFIDLSILFASCVLGSVHVYCFTNIKGMISRLKEEIDASGSASDLSMRNHASFTHATTGKSADFPETLSFQSSFRIEQESL